MSVISDVAAYLASQGLGTQGTNVFYSFIPDNAEAPVIMVRDTGGPLGNKDIPTLQKPTFQVFIRSNDYDTGKALLQQVYEILHGKYKNTFVPDGVYFREIFAQSQGGHIGRNEAGQDEFSINFIATVVEP